MHKKAGKNNDCRKIYEVYNRMVRHKCMHGFLSSTAFCFWGIKKCGNFPLEKLPQLCFSVMQHNLSVLFGNIPKTFLPALQEKRRSRSCDSYRIDLRPHFCTLPSQLPNDRLSPAAAKTFDTYTDSSSQGIRTPFPFHRQRLEPAGSFAALPTLLVHDSVSKTRRFFSAPTF